MAIITRKIYHVFMTYLLCDILTPVILTVEVSEFQYPCYVDVCTFPRQFCNSDKYERRCSPCAASLCRETRIPLACKYQCNKILNANKPTSKPTVSGQSSSDVTDEETSSLYLIVAYNAVVTTLFVILLMILIACYVQKKRTKTSTHIRQDSYRSYIGQPEGERLLTERILAERIAELEAGGHGPRESIPPSYRTLATGQNNVNEEENSSSIVTQPTEIDERPCRREMSDMDTQTTPKSVDKLSFDFNSTQIKDQE